MPEMIGWVIERADGRGFQTDDPLAVALFEIDPGCRGLSPHAWGTAYGC